MEQGETFALKLAAPETKGHRSYEALLAPKLSQALRR